MRANVDIIAIEPTIRCFHGRAWAMSIDGVCAHRGITREECGDLSSWIIEAAWAHPVWHSYWLHLQHLRPVAGERGAHPLKIHLEGATHEMVLFAIDPEKARQPQIETGLVHYLLPGNFAAQFIEPDDDAAIERIRKTVQLICDGNLSPDTDFLYEWKKRFGDNMVRS